MGLIVVFTIFMVFVVMLFAYDRRIKRNVYEWSLSEEEYEELTLRKK